MQWLFLIAAIAFEVIATLSLRVAAKGRSAFYAVTALGYLIAFSFLTLALNEGMGLGVAYGIWAASGVALTAIASKALFKEPLTPLMMGGIALIISGVLLVELGSQQDQKGSSTIPLDVLPSRDQQQKEATTP